MRISYRDFNHQAITPNHLRFLWIDRKTWDGKPGEEVTQEKLAKIHNATRSLDEELLGTG